MFQTLRRADGHLTSEGYPMVSPAVDVADAPVRVIFDRHEAEAMAFIDAHEVIVGCIAWLTSPEILLALRQRRASCVVMQKEDWLRPDYDGRHPARSPEGRRSYEAVNTILVNDMMPTLVSVCSQGNDFMPRYRVFGVTGDDRNRPVMHHKFLVGCRFDPPLEGLACGLVPVAVMTGSHNYSKGARGNLDNSIIIRDSRVAAAYFQEWGAICGNSEPLDFSATYVAPEWRVGT